MSEAQEVTNTNQAPAAPPAPADTSEVEDFGQRQHLVLEAARAEALAEAKADYAASEDAAPPVAEGEQIVEEVAAANAKPVEKTAPPSNEDKSRKVALANAARLEREAVKRSTELAAKAVELKAKELTFAEREAKLSLLEKAYNDPDALLSLLSEKVSPEKMSQFFIEAGQPEKVAERRAKQAQEPVNEEIKKLKDQLSAMEKKEADREAQAKAVAARESSERDFASRVLELKTDVPAAARLLEKRPREFFAMADMAAKNLMAAAEARGESATWDDVIVDVNKQLVEFARDLQDEASVSVAPSTPEKPKPTAAAKATTVSNRAASERSAILGDDDKWEALSFDDRVQRAMKRARAEG